MRVAVTGGAGLIGRATVGRLLERGHEVADVDRWHDRELSSRMATTWGTRYAAFEADVRDAERVAEVLSIHGSEAVVHLAAALGAQANADPWAAIEVNVSGSINVMMAAKELRCSRVVMASTAAVYGADKAYERSELPLTEGAAARISEAVPIYAASKLLVEKVARRLQQVDELPVCGLRPSVVYGPSMGERTGAAASGPAAIVEGALAGEPVELVSSTAPVPMVHVDDVAGQIEALLAVDYSRLEDTVFFNTGGDTASLLDIVSVVAAHVPEARIQVTPTGQGSYVGLPSEISDQALVTATGYTRQLSPIGVGIGEWLRVARLGN